eukprot:TRINITY_DN63170_c0_g1_i1.p1 TRINITY_DN63170_c0_g1~~TRINITY_DN63170_c0_g1_i1.p1  ORF type:complete len:647 (-),score=95.07 TRINITY_DN63170_c0_g1_i1:112-1968(-)
MSSARLNRVGRTRPTSKDYENALSEAAAKRSQLVRAMAKDAHVSSKSRIWRFEAKAEAAAAQQKSPRPTSASPLRQRTARNAAPSADRELGDEANTSPARQASVASSDGRRLSETVLRDLRTRSAVLARTMAKDAQLADSSVVWRRNSRGGSGCSTPGRPASVDSSREVAFSSAGPRRRGSLGATSRANSEDSRCDRSNSERRRREKNFSDLFGRETPARSSTPRRRADSSELATTDHQDLAVEIVAGRSTKWRTAHSSTPPRMRKNLSSNAVVPREKPRPTCRPTDPSELQAWALERASRDSAAIMDLNAEVERRVREQRHPQTGGDSPVRRQLSAAQSAAERKRVCQTSGQIREGQGTSPRPWDDGKHSAAPVQDSRFLPQRVRMAPTTITKAGYILSTPGEGGPRVLVGGYGPPGRTGLRPAAQNGKSWWHEGASSSPPRIFASKPDEENRQRRRTSTLASVAAGQAANSGTTTPPPSARQRSPSADDAHRLTQADTVVAGVPERRRRATVATASPSAGTAANSESDRNKWLTEGTGPPTPRSARRDSMATPPTTPPAAGAGPFFFPASTSQGPTVVMQRRMTVEEHKLRSTVVHFPPHSARARYMEGVLTSRNF